MIDKYKRPRVQRLIPQRVALPGRRGDLDEAVRIARQFANSLKRWDAYVSGAMPGDCIVQELRVR